MAQPVVDADKQFMGAWLNGHALQTAESAEGNSRALSEARIATPFERALGVGMGKSATNATSSMAGNGWMTASLPPSRELCPIEGLTPENVGFVNDPFSLLALFQVRGSDMNRNLFVGIAAIGSLFATPSVAAPYLVNVVEASGAGAFNATATSAPGLLARPDASVALFTYSGPLNFGNYSAQSGSNTGDITSAFFGANVAGISNYKGIGPKTVVYGANGANFDTEAGFLATSGSASNFAWGSLYSFTPMTTGNYGGETLQITHDDGASVYANGVLLSGLTAGPTSQVTENVTLPVGTTTYTIVYARENGSPSIFQVAAVPEPATWGMMILGFGLVGFAMRRRIRRSENEFDAKIKRMTAGVAA